MDARIESGHDCEVEIPASVSLQILMKAIREVAAGEG